MLAHQFDVDHEAVSAAAAELADCDDDHDRLRAEDKLRHQLAPPYLTLLTQFNALPQGVKFLVDLRTDLLACKRGDAALEIMDEILRERLSVWFDIGFLELRRITWDAPAALLEKLVYYEAVHQIDSWDVRATPSLIQSDAHSDFEALDTGAFEIATSGRTVIVGAPFEDQQGNDAGAVYSFDVPEPVDNLLQNPSPDPSDFFGTSVDIDGDWMVVGAYLDDTVAPNAGAAYAYENVGGRWEFRQSLDGATLASGYNFGWDVAIEDDLIVVATSTEGAAPIFVVSYRLSGGTWTLSEELTVVGAASTYSVDIDGTRVVIGDAFGDTAESTSAR